MMKRSGYDVPEVALPAQYKNSTSESAAAAVAPAETGILQAKQGALQEAELAEWWRLFGNQELAGLLDRGLANNPDLRIATVRVAQAKARADQARAGLMPSISAPVGVAAQFPSGAIGDVPVGTADRVTQTTYQASIRGSWRADIWGEQSSLAEAAKFQLWQAVFDRDNVQRNVTASLVFNYIEWLSLNDRLRVARETESVLNKMLANIEARMNAGEATLIELDQQKSNIYAARTQISSLEQQRENALANIAFLTGTVSGELKLSGGGLDALHLPHAIPSLPSSLLLRRPDVRMAEARLLAADANIDVARARILPALDLSAQAGYSSLSLSGLFQPSGLFWNSIASFTASIFDGGKLASEKENAKAIHEEMVEAYARTVYQAVREVETALAATRLSGKRLETKRDTVVAARRTWSNSAEMHAIGSVDNMALLDAKRAYQHHLDEYQQARVDNLRGYIELFHALGGGVDTGEQLPGKGARPAF
ncbi:MAG: TolC family protein, partial [Gallionellaceae bacterium]|nr:TolC family protein [Gallionellaceae bacterium]